MPYTFYTKLVYKYNNFTDLKFKVMYYMMIQ